LPSALSILDEGRGTFLHEFEVKFIVRPAFEFQGIHRLVYFGQAKGQFIILFDELHNVGLLFDLPNPIIASLLGLLRLHILILIISQRTVLPRQLLDQIDHHIHPRFQIISPRCFDASVSIETTENRRPYHFLVSLHSYMLVVLFSNVTFAKTQVYEVDRPFFSSQRLFSQHEVTWFNITVEIAQLVEFEDCLEGVVHDEKQDVFGNTVLELKIGEVLG
jgi:hypothetical protein